jgi:hypothetical protein
MIYDSVACTDVPRLDSGNADKTDSTISHGGAMTGK